MAAFGYGTKSDFTKGANYPAPNVYEKVSFITKNKQKAKGKTFGVSRKVIELVFLFIVNSQWEIINGIMLVELRDLVSTILINVNYLK